MTNCIEFFCYVFLKLYTQNLYETLPSFKSVIVMWALLLILQSADKYMETHECFRHLELINCELKRYTLLNISMEHTRACVRHWSLLTQQNKLPTSHGSRKFVTILTKI